MFYYYLLSLLSIYVQHCYYHYHYSVIILRTINIIIIIHIIFVIMDIVYACFNVSLYHVVSLKLINRFAFV